MTASTTGESAAKQISSMRVPKRKLLGYLPHLFDAVVDIEHQRRRHDRPAAPRLIPRKTRRERHRARPTENGAGPWRFPKWAFGRAWDGTRRSSAMPPRSFAAAMTSSTVTGRLVRRHERRTQRPPTKRLAAAATSAQPAQPVLRERRCDAARRGDGACAHRPDDR